jgi:hypothetical protein
MESSNTQEQEYLKSLNQNEFKSYLIAKCHLGSSFCLSKSIGYLQWLQKQTSKT